jgi:hypothetical protein
MPAPRKVTVGRVLLYWTHEDGPDGGELVPNPAIVLSVGDDGARVWLQVFWAGGMGGRDTLWAAAAAWSEQGTQVPTEGHWTWPESV